MKRSTIFAFPVYLLQGGILVHTYTLTDNYKKMNLKSLGNQTGVLVTPSLELSYGKSRRFINISFSSFWSPTVLVLGVQLCPETHEGGSEILMRMAGARNTSDN